MKNWYKSKTFWTGIATIATGLAMFFSGEQSLEELAVSFIGVIFTFLRFYTKTEIK